MRINILAFAVGAFLFSCSPTEKDKSPNYRIAYNVWVDGETDDYDVFTMNMDGSNAQNLTNMPGVQWTYHAYDSVITIISDHDTCARCFRVWESRGDGTPLTKISDLVVRDSWLSTRKNGQEYILSLKGDSTFVIIDRNGNRINRLGPGFAYTNDVAFSPDGNQIAFRGTQERIKGPGYLAEIFVMNVDGTGIKQLSKYPEQDTVGNWYRYRAGPPQWHPTENFISYNSVQNGIGKLFAVNPDGSGNRTLTPDSLYATWHAWSPDGKWLAFDGAIKENGQDNVDIYLMNYADGSIQRLTSEPTSEQAPVFVISKP